MKDLRSHLDHAAGRPPADGLDLEALHRRARTRRRARRTGIGGAVGAVALLAGLAVAVTAGGTARPTSVLTASASEDPPAASTDPAEPSTSTTDPTPTTSTVRPQDPAPTTTGPVAADPTDPKPSTTGPATATDSRVVGVAGTFESTPAPPFSIDGSRCPQIVSELDVALSLTDGRAWSLHEDGCGEILDDATRYHGGGPFTITTDDGETLTGRYESDAPLPTDGEPYTLTITEGTGSWAGAAGTCDLDNHMETLPSGLRRQFGTFTCVLYLGGDAAR